MREKEEDERMDCDATLKIILRSSITTSCPGLNVVAAQDISEIVLRDLQFLPLDLAS